MEKDREVEENLGNLVHDKVISEEDKPVFRLLLVAMKHGAIKETVKRFADCEEFDKWWDNLVKAGIFKDGKVIFTAKDDATFTIEFIMYGLVARGYVEREVYEEHVGQ